MAMNPVYLFGDVEITRYISTVLKNTIVVKRLEDIPKHAFVIYGKMITTRLDDCIPKTVKKLQETCDTVVLFASVCKDAFVGDSDLDFAPNRIYAKYTINFRNISATLAEMFMEPSVVKEKLIKITEGC